MSTSVHLSHAIPLQFRPVKLRNVVQKRPSASKRVLTARCGHLTSPSHTKESGSSILTRSTCFTGRRTGAKTQTLLVKSSAAEASPEESDVDESTGSSQAVVWLCAGALLLCNADRMINSVAQIPMAEELGLNMTSLATLQSAFLSGYGLTQIPGGYAADKLGGPRVLFGGMLLWSLSVILLPLCATFSQPLIALAMARALFGFGSGVAIPAASSVVGQWVAPENKTSGIATVFLLFNMGAGLGPLVAGLMVKSFPWQYVYYTFGFASLAWVIYGWFSLPPAARAPLKAPEPAPKAGADVEPATKEGKAPTKGISKFVISQVAVMTFVHAAYNMGFFTLQAWIPMYLKPLFGEFAGIASAFPWFLSAAVGYSAGLSADYLMKSKGWSNLNTRRFFLGFSSLIPAACLLTLSFTSSPVLAFVLLMVAAGSQATFVSGYHAYVQDVASAQAGQLIGFTNTWGIFSVMAATVGVGYILDKTGNNFSIVFMVTAAVYVALFVVGATFLSGKKLFPDSE
ncbi:hypothetical protein CYMTET_19193 [Cymbomonas tetramitiformis]|uniref:Major facilitator superfamily (MFS) profile domain-containing protein n=1 Tax=Cymbomonas tetramitiformis TaxID=36881 RepID=A0AAE0G6H9_9CHLO|nr:hypothetical protein CYMTET_19193 [Cymbomonas tetramitiformis]